MVTRIPPVPAHEERATASGSRAFALGAALIAGGLVLVGCGDGSTVDNPDEAAPSTSATVAAKVETRDPTTTAASDQTTTTTSADTTETSSATTSTIVSTTTSQPGKTLVLQTTTTTVRSTTSSTAAPVTTSPPATVATTTTAAAVTTTTAAASDTSTTAAGESEDDDAAAADESSTSSADGAAADGADEAPGGDGAGVDSTADADNTAGDGDGAATDSSDDGSTAAGDSDSAESTTDDAQQTDTTETVDLPPLVPGVVDRPTCTPRPDSDGRIACTATLRNDLEAFTRISTSVAFFDEAGTQLSTENRFMNYVGPGEVFVQQFFGPASTARADVLASTPTAIAEPQVGDARTTERAIYLPVDLESVQLGTLEPDTLGRQTSVVTVENSSGSAGTVTVKVAFYDADGVRVSNESRFVQGVEDGARVTRKFIGDPDAVSVRLLEVSVAPTE